MIYSQGLFSGSSGAVVRLPYQQPSLKGKTGWKLFRMLDLGWLLGHGECPSQLREPLSFKGADTATWTQPQVFSSFNHLGGTGFNTVSRRLSLLNDPIYAKQKGIKDYRLKPILEKLKRSCSRQLSWPCSLWFNFEQLYYCWLCCFFLNFAIFHILLWKLHYVTRNHAELENAFTVHICL